MNNYLLHLLKEVKTLIIPGLGALTVTNESTGEILFMPYLKFDDGTLAQHIATKEKMDINDAKNMIAKFVHEVTVELDKGSSYDMYQFGSFAKEDGEIVFKMWDASAPQKEVKAVVDIPAEKKEHEVVPEITKEEPEVEIVEESKKDETATPIVEKTPVAEPKVAIVSEAPKAEPSTEEMPKAEIKEEPKAATKKVEKTEKPAKVVKEKAEKTVKEKVVKEKKKRSVFAYILWGFLFILLGAGTFVAIKFDDLKKDFPILADLVGENDNAAKGSEDMKILTDDSETQPENETESEQVPEDDVQVIEDNQSTTTPEKEETPKTEVKKPVAVEKQNTSTSSSFDGSKKYHIIAGAFGSEANAIRMVDKLKSDGFSEASTSFVNGMHRVSVKGFSSMADANSELSSIREKVPSAWVMKM